MNLKEIMEQVDQDIKVDKSVLDLESLRNPELHNKYLKMFIMEGIALKKLYNQENRLLLEKTNYYSGKADPNVYKEKPFNIRVLKQDLDNYVNADVDMIALRNRIIEQKALVDYLSSVVDNINNRNWNIRNAVEFLKFKNGIN